MHWLAIGSVVLNALAAIFTPVLGRKLMNRQVQLEKTQQTLETVAAGLGVVERAVEQNKDLIAKTGYGDKITQTIRTYGPAAKTLVDTARQAAADVRDAATVAYEQNIIAREYAEHEARVAREAAVAKQ